MMLGRLQWGVATRLGWLRPKTSLAAAADRNRSGMVGLGCVYPRDCGFHVWMSARTVEAWSAATTFLRLLSRPLAEDAPSKLASCAREFCGKSRESLRSSLPRKSQIGVILLALSRKRSDLTEKLTGWEPPTEYGRGLLRGVVRHARY